MSPIDIPSISHVWNNHSNKRYPTLDVSHSKIHLQTRLELEKVFNLDYGLVCMKLKWWIGESIFNKNEASNKYLKRHDLVGQNTGLPN